MDQVHTSHPLPPQATPFLAHAAVHSSRGHAPKLGNYQDRSPENYQKLDLQIKASLKHKIMFVFDFVCLPHPFPLPPQGCLCSREAPCESPFAVSREKGDLGSQVELQPWPPSSSSKGQSEQDPAQGCMRSGCQGVAGTTLCRQRAGSSGSISSLCPPGSGKGGTLRGRTVRKVRTLPAGLPEGQHSPKTLLSPRTSPCAAPSTFSAPLAPQDTFPLPPLHGHCSSPT